MGIIMICKRLFILIGLTLPLIAQAQERVYTPQAQEELDRHVLKAAGISAFALITGYAYSNRMLTGIGIGTATGTACAALEKSAHWILLWSLDRAARETLVWHLDSNQYSILTSIVLNKSLKNIKYHSPIDPFSWLSSWVAYLVYNHKATELTTQPKADKSLIIA